MSSNNKKHWQKALHTIKHYTSPRVGELESELISARHDFTRLGLRASALASERDTLSRKLEDSEQRIGSVQSRLDAATRQHERSCHELRQQLQALRERFDRAEQRRETLEAELGERDRRIRHLESERDSVRRQLQEASAGAGAAGAAPAGQLPADRSRPAAWRPAMLFGIPLFLGALASATTLDIINGGQPSPAPAAAVDSVALMALQAGTGTPDPMPLVGLKPQSLALRLMADETRGAETPKPAPAPVPPTGTRTVSTDSAQGTAKPVAAVATVPERSWGEGGPPLLMAEAQKRLRVAKPGFDPAVKQLQENLMVLGFELGESGADGLRGRRTVQALEEFRLLYQQDRDEPAQAGDNEQLLAAMVKYHADLAREDAVRYRVSPSVVAAIRLASVRTGVEFGFLMELAAAESNFDSLSKAVESSAAGLYQYTRETWLKDLKSYGEEIGLDMYASKVEYYVDRKGRRRPMIKDDGVYRHVLDLRYNPRVSALLAAASVKNNSERLAFSLDRQPGRTDVYLTHFLGPRGAISFLRILDENPHRIAGEVFPRAAASNQSIFGSVSSKPRTLNEVYQIFDRKFNTDRFKDPNPG